LLNLELDSEDVTPNLAKCTFHMQVNSLREVAVFGVAYKIKMLWCTAIPCQVASAVCWLTVSVFHGEHNKCRQPWTTVCGRWWYSQETLRQHCNAQEEV